MLSNRLVFLAQRCTKFKKKCVHGNSFLRTGGGQGRRRCKPTFVFST